MIYLTFATMAEAEARSRAAGVILAARTGDEVADLPWPVEQIMPGASGNETALPWRVEVLHRSLLDEDEVAVDESLPGGI
jgi:hypothetical protein